MRDSHGKLEIVQAMRGIAALAVVFWHASRFFGPYGTGWAAQVFQPGANMGVDLFFLISGFIMVVTTGRRSGTVRDSVEFIVKRFTRIWPPYVIATLLYIALIPAHWATYQSANGAGYLAHSLLLLPRAGTGIEAPVFDYPSLSVGWTLNYEMYFYVIFAASMLFGRARWAAFTAILAITLLGIPIVLAPRPQLSILPATHYGLDGTIGLMSNPLILLFAAGCGIGLIYRSKLAIQSAFLLRLAMFLTATFVVYQYCAWFRVMHGITQDGLSLVPLLLVFVLASKAVRLSVPGPLVYLGDISFSLYIFHPLVQEGFDALTQLLGGAAPSGFPAFFVTTALALALASISHRYIEKGLCDRLRGALLKPRLRPVGALTETPI